MAFVMFLCSCVCTQISLYSSIALKKLPLELVPHKSPKFPMIMTMLCGGCDVFYLFLKSFCSRVGSSVDIDSLLHLHVCIKEVCLNLCKFFVTK